MILPTLEYERTYQKNGYAFIIGIDEAGRGPLAGSVVAGACARKNLAQKISKEDARLIRDSKSLSERQREKAFDIVREYFYVGVGECDAEAIDRINILQATFLAMKKSVSQLQGQLRNNQQLPTTNQQQKSTILFIDGNQTLTLSLEQRAIPQGDTKVQSIAAASIIAKVTRDRQMLDAHTKYPLYGFDRHKGYGTKIHTNALRKYGPTPLHRRSFGPVKRIVRELRQYGADV